MSNITIANSAQFNKILRLRLCNRIIFLGQKLLKIKVLKKWGQKIVEFSQNFFKKGINIFGVSLAV